MTDRILVTGATAHLGDRLLRALATRGATVRVVGEDPVRERRALGERRLPVGGGARAAALALASPRRRP